MHALSLTNLWMLIARRLVGALTKWMPRPKSFYSILVDWCPTVCPPCIYGPRQANLVLITYASSEGSGERSQNLRCSLIKAVSQEEPSDRKPDPWPLWMAGHAQLKLVMTEWSKTQIRLSGLVCSVMLHWLGWKTLCKPNKYVHRNPGAYSKICCTSSTFSTVSYEAAVHVLFDFVWAKSWENLSYAICDQQRRRSACASAQPDQRLCSSLPR